VTDPALDAFEAQRPTLFGIAYRILASVADTEDILQEAWLKWSSVDPDSLDQPRAYLARTVTNLSINRLKSATMQRESYVGPWLPEPLVTADDAGPQAEQAEAVSLAMLVVMETLSPLERDNVIVIDLGHDDRIETIRLIRNPDKLAHLVPS
jgi:RNA polymerase sigma-70 factor, ECF subfamily